MGRRSSSSGTIYWMPMTGSPMVSPGKATGAPERLRGCVGRTDCPRPERFSFFVRGAALRLPQVEESLVPDLAGRTTVAAMQPYLNAFPASPRHHDDLVNQIGRFSASFSNRASLDATRLRVDQRLDDQLTLFGTSRLFAFRKHPAWKPAVRGFRSNISCLPKSPLQAALGELGHRPNPSSTI